MTEMEALIRNKEGAIMLFATPEEIDEKRRNLEKWRADQLAAIPNRVAAIADQMGTSDGIVKRVAFTSGDLVAAQQEARVLLKRYGTPVIPQAIEILKILETENEYLDRLAALNRIAKRSEAARFAVPPAPVRRGMN